MDANRLEALEHRIERAALLEYERETGSAAGDDLTIAQLAPFRAAVRMLIRNLSAIESTYHRSLKA